MMKAGPEILCSSVAASTQMKSIARPRTTVTGASRRHTPPACHCGRDAATKASPAAAKPAFPKTHRSTSIASNDALGAIGNASDAGANAASSTEQTPERMVQMPESISRRNASAMGGVSRIVTLFHSRAAEAASDIPETTLASPPEP